MSKIYCYSLDFHKKEKEFEDIDSLLKSIVGAKEQANNALNNPDLSYRGFRLISEDKLNVLLPQILTTKSEKIKSDYVDNIAKLEGKIKKLEKSERKSTVKMDVLKDDHESELKELTKKFSDEKELLNKEHINKVNKLQEDSDSKIAELTKNYLNDVEKIKNAKDSEMKKVIDIIEKYTKDVRMEISEYNKNLAILKDNHNAQLEDIYEQKEAEYKKILDNKDLFTSKIKYNLNDMGKTVSELIDIINIMISNENKEMGTEVPNVRLEKEIILANLDKVSGKYTPLNEKALLGKSDKLSLDPLMITSTFDIDDIYGKQVEVVTKVESSEKTKDVPREKISIKVESPRKSAIVNGKPLITNDKYESMSVEDKVKYLIDIRPTEYDLQKMCKEYPNLEKELNNRVFLKTVIGESIKQNLYYKDIKDLVKENIAKNLSQTVILSRVDYNKYFDIVEVVGKADNSENTPTPITNNNSKEVPADSVESIIEQDRKQVNQNKDVDFDWNAFKGKYVRTEEMKLLFGRESISLREASATINVPSGQIKLMMGTLKTLNYIRRFNNPNLLTPDELLLFIVTDGWYKASIKRNSEESLQKILKKLYPSWLEFIAKK